MAEREELLGAARLAPRAARTGVIPASSLPRLSDRNRRELMCPMAEREGFEPSMGF
jgi:hypothetical protein